MVDIEYANAYSEVLEILKYISKDDYNKIPQSKIELFKKIANPNYKFTYNPAKTLDEQNVSKTAKAIIIILFRDYWATQVQRENIIAEQNYARQKLEEDKRKKYNPDNIFKKDSQTEKNQNITNDLAYISDKVSLSKKITQFIRKFLHLDK